MPSKRYEITDEQREQIKDLFAKAKTGRPPKVNRLMFNGILWIAPAVLHGVTCPNVSVRGKLSTAVSVNGVMTKHWQLLFMH